MMKVERPPNDITETTLMKIYHSLIIFTSKVKKKNSSANTRKTARGTFGLGASL